MLQQLPLGHQARVKDLATTCVVYYPNAQENIVVWREKDKILGFAAWRIILDEAELLSIAVHPEARGQGIATALLTNVIQRWHKVCCGFLEVRASNHIAQHLYHKHGFRQIARRHHYYPTANGTEDAIIMKITLTQETS